MQSTTEITINFTELDTQINGEDKITLACTTNLLSSAEAFKNGAQKTLEIISKALSHKKDGMTEDYQLGLAAGLQIATENLFTAITELHPEGQDKDYLMGAVNMLNELRRIFETLKTPTAEK